MAHLLLAAALAAALGLALRAGPGRPTPPLPAGRLGRRRSHAAGSRWSDAARSRQPQVEGARRRPPPAGRPTSRPWWWSPAARRDPLGVGVARWAGRRDLAPLAVAGPTPGRLTVGRAGRRLVAVDAGQSLLVVGPTQSHKTSSLAIPAILEWQGPVVAASVKADLARHTAAWRRRHGHVWIYDPTASSGLPADRWSPLDAVRSWPDARRVAAELVAVARADSGSLTDADFWYATAAKLLAPLLLGAAVSGRPIADVVRWLDEQQVDEVADALHRAGEHAALAAAQATWARDDRQRSAVYTTAETVLDVFAEPAVAASARTGPGAIDPAAVVSASHTLYLCAPAHDQRRLRPVFAGLVTEVLRAAYDRTAAGGQPLHPPLLVVIDEAANVAPLADLDVLASTAAGHGVQLLTIWQDLAQVTARYGTRAGTVLNNHRAKLFLSGIADPATLEQASSLIGDAELPVAAVTHDGHGSASTTTTPTARRLLPPDALRRLPPGRGVLVAGHLPPVPVTLRPFFADPQLRRQAAPHQQDR